MAARIAYCGGVVESLVSIHLEMGFAALPAPEENATHPCLVLAARDRNPGVPAADSPA